MKTDTEFRELKLKSVEKEPNGYTITDEHGWSLGIPDVGVEPVVGDTARYYGKGIGFSVRGVTINGKVIYYRTVEEQEEKEMESLYPKECAEALRRWDAGESIFTVEMGGLGPGYEQCIHIMVFEILRDWIGKPLPEFKKGDEKSEREWWDWANESIARADKTLSGVSGAQAGAAKSLAYRALRDGWRKCIQSAPKGRSIQVGKRFP